MKDLIKVSGKQLYKTSIGVEADDVIIGDKISVDFKPQVTFTKWKDKKGDPENSLTIKVPAGLIASNTPTLVNGKVEVKDSKTGFYFNPDPDNVENFKFGLLLFEKPTTNTWSFQLEGWEEFDFFEQPPLANTEPDGSTWEDNGHGRRKRPADVNGSYAVYHKTKANHIIGQTNYRTGKFCHIYRPKFIDANGNWVWADLHIENGIYTVTVPQSFLDTAATPIKANDTFGNTGVGGTGNGQNSDQPTLGGYFNLSVNGNVSKITAYCSGDGGNGTGNIYTDSAGEPNTPQGNTGATAIPTPYGSPVWFDVTYGTPLSLNSGNYWLGMWGSLDYWEIYYDTATAETRDKLSPTGYTYPTYPNPWDTVNDRTLNQRLSIYATYTAGGAVNQPTQLIMCA